MRQVPKILAIIPARKGSKGLPGKNVRELLGKPLIAWTIEQAKACRHITEIFVSTDCPEIARTAESFGVSVPALRPAALAKDDSSSADLVEFILDGYKKRSVFFDYIMLLEPTSPLRDENDLDQAVALLLREPGKDGVVSLGEIALEHPRIVKRVDSAGKLQPFCGSPDPVKRRQDLGKAYFPYGVVYLIKESVFRDRRVFYTENMAHYFIQRWQNFEVDDLCDFICIEAVLRARKTGVL
jgi:CMP-N,N'-diacetyllegionaminic acid synthase